MPTAKPKKAPSRSAAKSIEAPQLKAVKPELVRLESLIFDNYGSRGNSFAEEGSTPAKCRAADEDHVEQIRCDLENGAELPPLDVMAVSVMEDGAEVEALIVIGGNHRLEAYRRLKKPPAKVLARVHRNLDSQAAYLWSIADNRKHGRPLSNAEKRQIVHELLLHSEFKRRSTRAIADFVGCSHQLVADLKNELAGKPTTKQKANLGVKNSNGEPIHFDPPALDQGATRTIEIVKVETPPSEPKTYNFASAEKTPEPSPKTAAAKPSCQSSDHAFDAIDNEMFSLEKILSDLSNEVSESGDQSLSDRIFEIGQKVAKTHNAIVNLFSARQDEQSN